MVWRPTATFVTRSWARSAGTKTGPTHTTRAHGLFVFVGVAAAVTLPTRRLVHAAARLLNAICDLLFGLIVRLRQVRIAGIAQSNRACSGPGAVRSPRVQSSLSIDCRREPAVAALTIEFASPARCPVVSALRHGLSPSVLSVGCAPKEQGEDPRAVNQIGTRPPGRCDKLDDLVHKAKQVPLRDQARVNREEVYEIR